MNTTYGEKPISLLYYEDNVSLREGISYLFNYTPRLNLLGAFGNCDKLIEQVQTLKPAVILMDIDLPGINGLEATKIIKSISPEIEVIMLTVFDDEEKIFPAIRYGASGYLLKSASPSEIIEAIFQIHAGGSHMTSNIARKVLQYFHDPVKKKEYSLSERELEIIKGLLNGYSYKLIGSKMGIKIDTVRSHIRNIYEKLQVNSKTEAILKAIENKLIK